MRGASLSTRAPPTFSIRFSIGAFFRPLAINISMALLAPLDNMTTPTIVTSGNGCIVDGTVRAGALVGFYRGLCFAIVIGASFLEVILF